MLPMSTDPSIRLRRAVIQQLECLEASGMTDVPRPPAFAPVNLAASKPTASKPAARPAPAAAAPRPVAPARPPAAPVAAQPVPPTPAAEPAMPRRQPAPGGTTSGNQDADARRAALAVIQREVAKCTRCPELVANRTQTVFGVGNVAPRLAFFGEAPGADEDRTGEPFVGAAGKLLNDIIQAMGFQREDVYILNVLKCRPPSNRAPETDEVENCRHFHERQLDILKPEFVCCLGLHAAKALLRSTLSVGKLRSKVHEYGSSKVVVTYHPAYLLRNPPAKKDVWEDMKFLLGEMGLKPPAPKK